MAAAGSGYRRSGKSRAKSSTQGWSPNSGQAAEDESGSFVGVLVSEQGQQSFSSCLTLPQQNQQAGTQIQSASSLDQLQSGLGQYQPAGNNETPLARDDFNSDVIVNAQLIHFISRDDATQGQDAPHVPEALMPDAPSESSCAHFLDARLEFFGLKIGLLFGPWFVLNVVLLRCRTRRAGQKQQIQARIRKVATLARTGDKGRALAAARNAPPVPVAEQIVQDIKSLYPTDPEPPAPASASISALFLSEVAEQVPTTLRKMPRLSEPGPLGMRAEHWYDFGSLAGNSDLFVQVIAHIAAAAVPSSVLQYLKAGQITPLAKPTGGHRPLLMMSFLRRLALKSVMAAKKESVAKCAGPLKTRWSKYDDQDHPIPCRS